MSLVWITVAFCIGLKGGKFCKSVDAQLITRQETGGLEVRGLQAKVEGNWL